MENTQEIVLNETWKKDLYRMQSLILQ